MNNLALAGALVTAPSSAFAELRERPRFWFPLLLIVLSSTAMVYWYYSVVDFEWLKDLMFSHNPKFEALPEAQRAAAMGTFSRPVLLWSSVIGTLVIVPFFFVLQSLYFWVAAKVTKIPLGFKHWFALTAWSTLPILLGTVVGAILLLLSHNTQISPSSLAPFFLNELVFHRPFGSAAQPILDSLTITGFICWGLMIFGVRTWSQRSWFFSAAYVLLYIAVFYAVVSYIAFK